MADVDFLYDSDDEWEYDLKILLLASMLCKRKRSFVPRRSALFRKRWDSEYLINLAVQEASFVAEYRVDPEGFSLLHDLLGSLLDADPKFAALRPTKSGSGIITAASRIGAALIMLGGRAMEAMRTHGMARSTAYKNFHGVMNRLL